MAGNSTRTYLLDYSRIERGMSKSLRRKRRLRIFVTMLWVILVAATIASWWYAFSMKAIDQYRGKEYGWVWEEGKDVRPATKEEFLRYEE